MGLRAERGARRTGARAPWPGVLLLPFLLIGCEQAPPEIAELSGQTMGTGYSIKLSPAPPGSRLTQLQSSVERRLETINRQMSTYRPDSDLMRFNHSASINWQAQPAAVVELVEQAAAVSVLSDGRYDITVGPLVNLWGFGNSGERDAAPAARVIHDTLARVGYRQLETRQEPPALKKNHPQLEIDLSSIAKGWAVDQIAELVRSAGFSDFLVEIGGELRAHGQKAPGIPWRIAIEQPSYETRVVQRIIALQDVAMATSGDYRNFFTDDGQRYSHTIDPETGRPVRHRLASVTVLAEECATADAWATALLALGEQHGPDLADAQGLRALFIVRAGKELREQFSRAWLDAGLSGEAVQTR
jgi:thiamine biosynthesis lipoprotein